MIDNYANIGEEGRSDVYAVFTLILCGTKFCVNHRLKLIFLTYPVIACQSPN